ncbi:MAG TPA: M20/M25/M40 family metallo-hydrolase [Vicinamibacterales bacterium]|nr:M20/M25/M40 family metallo-hydrolase [Vicinamibacterales bacterium]
MMMRRGTFGLFVACLLAAAPASAQASGGEPPDEAVSWLQAYLRVNTINPPGNEAAGVQFFKAIFDAEGIPYDTVESAPGRGNIWARLEGGDQPALMLLHHMDVVPANRASWRTDPLSGEIRDGYLYGRGALDTKSSGILHLAALVALHRSKAPLDRDVVFLATADEEAGGYLGVGWLVKNRPELFRNVGYVINEGGEGRVRGGRIGFGIEVTQKVPYWLRLTARGEPGHGSTPRAASAVTTLVAALERLRLHQFEARIVPAVAAYFKGIAPAVSPAWRERFTNIDAAIREPGVVAELQRDDPALHALVRNTCSITRLDGSDKINVIPPEARAEIDCRLLPDQDPKVFLAELDQVLGGEIQIETLMGFTPAVSPPDTDVYRAIEAVCRQHFPEAPVVPAVLGGFTDSHFVRDLGITAYGFTPVVIPFEDERSVHGNDERISVENVRRGARMMLEIVKRIAAK